MGIFDGLSVDAGQSTLGAALRIISDKVKEQREQYGACSLAELNLDEQDYTWLRAWIRRLDERIINMYLHPDVLNEGTNEQAMHRVVIGSLLLLHAVELQRRNMPVSTRWLLPAAHFFHENIRPLLYSEDGPSYAYLSSLRAAGAKLQLREGRTNGTLGFLRAAPPACYTPENLETFLLAQGGFNGAGLREKLSQGIVDEDYPPAIESLLNEETGSPSFKECWRALRAYRQLAITEEYLRQVLRQSPWFSPAWIDSLIASIEVVPRPTSELVLPAEILPVPGEVAERVDEPAQRQSHTIIQSEINADVFYSITPYGGCITVIKAVRALVARIDQLELGDEPWSLAELQLTDYDYIWLRVWVKRVEPFVVQYCSENTKTFKAGERHLSFSSALGLLLLAWLSETARREADEGELWPHVSTGHFCKEENNQINETVNELLFAQGQHTRTLCTLLEAAAKQFNLRHVLKEANAQRWLNTVYLQFGFTLQGLYERLPYWLAGRSTTRSITLLQSDNLLSQSFTTLWGELRAFRQGHLPEPKLRATLQASPWVMPDWIDGVVRKAQKTIQDNAQPDDAADGLAPSAIEDELLLTAPRLVWPAGNTPYFVCQVQADLTSLNLHEPCYDLYLGNKLEGQLLRQLDGSYLPVPSAFLTLQLTQATLTASLRNEEGETVYEQELTCWPPADEVVVYRMPQGTRVFNPFEQPLATKSSYGLFLAADFTIKPEPTEWYLVASGTMKLYRLPAGWDTKTQVFLEDEIYWEPTIAAPAQPVWSDLGVFLDDTKSVKWEEEFHARIIHRAEIKILSVRCYKQPIQFKLLDEITTLIGPLKTHIEFDARKLDVQIRAEKDGRVCTIRRQLDLNFIGAKHLRDGVWRPLHKNSVLTVEQAERDLFKILFPSQWQKKKLEIKELVLVEGEGICHPRPLGNGNLGSLNGWGAPLRISPLFNSATTFSLNLAESVVNYGLLTNAICEAAPDGLTRILRLSFKQQLEPSFQHKVIWWDTDGQIISLTPKYWDEAEGKWWWVTDLPETCSEPIAVAVSSEGCWLGCQWQEGQWMKPLPLLAKQNARQVAALLRWFHLPLLSQSAQVGLRSLLASYPTDILCAWLLNEGLPDDLSLPHKDEVWLAVVRTLFSEWQPTLTQAFPVLAAIAQVETEADLRLYLSDAALPLSEVDPLLLGKLLRHWQTPQKKTLLQQLRLELAKCNDAARLTAHQTALLQQAAKDLRIDEGFIQTGILERAVHFLQGNKIDMTAERNLAVAARIPALRHVLTLHVLANL